MKEKTLNGLFWNVFLKGKEAIANTARTSIIVLVILLIAGIILSFLKSGIRFFLELISEVPLMGTQPAWAQLVLMGLVVISIAIAINIKGDKLKKSQKHFQELSYTERKIIVISRLSEILSDDGYTKVVKVHTWPGIFSTGFTHEKEIPKLRGIPVAILSSPAPVTGFTVIVDTAQYFNPEIIEQIDLTVEEGLEIVVSFGSLTQLEELAQNFKKF